MTLSYTEILTLVKKLPTHQKIQLKSDLEESISKKKTKKRTSEFLENRKHFNEWRKN